MIPQLIALLVPLFVVALPFLLVVGVLTGGVLLGFVILAIVGAVRSGFVREPEAEQVDVEELFEERAAAAASDRNDSI